MGCLGLRSGEGPGAKPKLSAPSLIFLHRLPLVSGHLLRCSDTVLLPVEPCPICPPPHSWTDRLIQQRSVEPGRPQKHGGWGPFSIGTQLPAHSAEARRHSMSTGWPAPSQKSRVSCMIWTELGSKFSSPVALMEPQHHLGVVVVSGTCGSDYWRKSHPAGPQVPSPPAEAGPGAEEGGRW